MIWLGIGLLLHYRGTTEEKNNCYVVFKMKYPRISGEVGWWWGGGGVIPLATTPFYSRLVVRYCISRLFFLHLGNLPHGLQIDIRGNLTCGRQVQIHLSTPHPPTQLRHSRVSPFRLKKFFAYKRNKANLDPFHMCFTISL
jgi:hypothetical protein